MRSYRRRNPDSELRLELLCGYSEAPRRDPAYFEGEVHPKQLQIEREARRRGIRASAVGHDEDDGRYSDAYLYFAPDRVVEVAEMLRRVRFPGDILDVPAGLPAHTEAHLREVCRRERWEYRVRRY